MGDQKKVTIVGVPMDLGQMRRGVDMGPSAIRCAGVKEKLESLSFNVEDLGDIPLSKEMMRKVSIQVKN